MGELGVRVREYCQKLTTSVSRAGGRNNLIVLLASRDMDAMIDRRLKSRRGSSYVQLAKIILALRPTLF